MGMPYPGSLVPSWRVRAGMSPESGSPAPARKASGLRRPAHLPARSPGTQGRLGNVPGLSSLAPRPSCHLFSCPRWFHTSPPS